MAKIDIDYIWTDKKRTLFGLPLSFTRYILTDKKLITRTGFFTIHEDEIELYRISDKSLSATFGQRMFGCGTVHIDCRDVDTPEKDIVSIKKPREFMNKLEEQVDIQRDRYSVRGRDMIGLERMGHEHGHNFDDMPSHCENSHGVDFDDNNNNNN